MAHELGKNQNQTNSSQEQLKEFQEAITAGVQRVFQSGIAEMEKTSANKRAIVAAMKACNLICTLVLIFKDLHRELFVGCFRVIIPLADFL